MPDIADAAAQARKLARRGADAAAVVLDAGTHPLRTAREGAQLVQGLVNRHDEEGTEPSAQVAPPESPTPDPIPGPATVVKEPAAPEPVEALDLPVEPGGPKPHMPPDIADEVERDYGDEVPGIKEWED